MLEEKLKEYPFLGCVNFACFWCEGRDCFPRVFISHLTTLIFSTPTPSSLCWIQLSGRGAAKSQQKEPSSPAWVPCLFCAHTSVLLTWNVPSCPWQTAHTTCPLVSRLKRTILSYHVKASYSWSTLITSFRMAGIKYSSTKEGRCLKSVFRSLHPAVRTLFWSHQY